MPTAIFRRTTACGTCASAPVATCWRAWRSCRARWRHAASTRRRRSARVSQQAGDHASAAILDVILRRRNRPCADRQPLVSSSVRCGRRSIRIATYARLAEQYHAPKLRGPFNFEARRDAGFDEAELRGAGRHWTAELHLETSVPLLAIIERSFFSGSTQCVNTSVRFRRRARRASARAALGQARRADALHAAWLDGRRGVVPVRRRCARRRLAGDRARCARLRAVGLAGRRARRRQLLVPGLSRRPRRAARPLRADMAKSIWSATAWARTSSACMRACGRSGCGAWSIWKASGSPPPIRSAVARRACATGSTTCACRPQLQTYASLDDVAGAPDQHQPAPRAGQRALFLAQHWSKPDGRRPFHAARRSGAQAARAVAVSAG